METNFSVKTVECKGFTKAEALEKVTDFTTDFNATTAWVNAGKPTVGTPGFKTFCVEYLKKKTKANKGLGCYIVIESGVADSRENPYKVLSVPTTKARKFKRSYQITEADLKKKVEKVVDEEGKEKEAITATIEGLGAVVAKYEKKGEAEKAMKEIITLTKRDYAIQIVNECVEGEPIAAYGIYTPSVSAKQGTYIAFGICAD